MNENFVNAAEGRSARRGETFKVPNTVNYNFRALCDPRKKTVYNRLSDAIRVAMQFKNEQFTSSDFLILKLSKGFQIGFDTEEVRNSIDFKETFAWAEKQQ
jgi:hypothetical protein